MVVAKVVYMVRFGIILKVELVVFVNRLVVGERKREVLRIILKGLGVSDEVLSNVEKCEC